MDIWTTTEEAYKNGYAKGYEDGRRDAKKVVICMNCLCGEIVKYPNGKVWCQRMCRYMNKEGFCSDGCLR